MKLRCHTNKSLIIFLNYEKKNFFGTDSSHYYHVNVTRWRN